jgi:signal peptidase II
MRLGLMVAGVTLVLDQALKLWILFVYELAGRGRVPVLPFMDLVMVWNRGISYGLFQQDGAFGRFVLFAISAVASVFLLAWLRREGSRFSAVALGLILGGAVGNAIDRLAYGAVADFVLLHAGGWEWYVFNIADAAIVVGVALLLYAAIWRGNRPHEAKTPAAGNEG